MKTKIKLLALSFVVLSVGISSVSNLADQTPEIKNVDEKVAGTANVPDVLSLGENEKVKVFQSEPVKAQFEFNAIAPHWKEEAVDESLRTFEIRTSDNNRDWTDWTKIAVGGPLRDDDPKADEMFPETPLFTYGKYFQYRLTLARGQISDPTPIVRDLKINYIDSREPLSSKLTKTFDGKPDAVQAADQGPTILPRSAWGSPDPYGDSFKGQGIYWEPSYTPVSQVFLHHTVTQNRPPDPASEVRAIWQYHTYTRGWGDIGYNYLVDHNGTIYEGRAGGDNVTAGHVFGYNEGSMGVALLGCFQPGSCPGNTSTPWGMQDSLYNLLGWKTKNYEIGTYDAHNFCGGPGVGGACINIPVIAGHRDADSTSCPGDVVHGQLQSIRDGTHSRKLNLFPYSAKQLSFDTVVLPESGNESVTLEFKNTGNTTWTNTGQARLMIRTANPSQRASNFAGVGWINSNTPDVLNESSVTPGQTGTFTFNLRNSPGASGLYFEGFELISDNNTVLHGYFNIKILAPTYRWSAVSTSYSSGSSNMSPGETQTVTVVVKNIGTATWSNSGINPVKLGTWSPGRVSNLYHSSSWPDQTRPAELEENEVEPGENGTFIFTVQAPNQFGEYREYLNLVAENLTWFPEIGMHIYINVVNPYQWQFVWLSHSTGDPKMDPGDTQIITVKARNTGTATWTKAGSIPVRLGTWPPQRNSEVSHSSWFAPGTRPAQLTEDAVAPGSIGTFSFTVRMPRSGEFFEKVNLVAEGITWFNDQNVLFYLRGRSGYSWQLVDLNHSTGTVSNPHGSTLILTLRARNTGDVTWRKTGDFPVRLGTTHPQNRESALARPSWITNYRPVGLTEDAVPPGSIGTFQFEAQVPDTTGEYFEYFSLVAENFNWFNDPGDNIYIRSI